MLRKEDFYNRVMQDLYPELDSDISFDPKMDKRNLGTYNPNNGKVELSPEIANQDIRKGLSTSIHEQAHKYDDKILKYNMPKTLITGKNADTQLNLDKALNRFLDAETAPGPSSLYEVAAKGHHARIPNLRDADSFGLGALKSMMKSGTFRQVAGALPLAGTALALSSGDASAAAAELPSEIPILGQAYDAVRSEDAGSSADDMEMINEDKARKSYAKSPAHQDRNQALRAQALKAIAKK